MNFNRFILLLILFGLNFAGRSQNAPVFDVPESDTVFVDSGNDFLVVSNIGDGDDGNQELVIEVSSANDAILEVDSFTYTPGNRMALVWVSEKGITGTSQISVSVTDEDGTTSKDFDVAVSEYTHHGIKFEVHDAVFWQEVVPLNETPIYQSVIQSTNMTSAYNQLNWNNIPLTVSAGCNNTTLCDGHDFSTGFMEGYLVPKKSGSYTFYMSGDGDYALFLSTDKSFDNAEVIAAKSDNYGTVGTAVSGRKSAPVALDSGKVYAIYAVVWNIHQEKAEVKWELQGEFTARYIDGAFLYPLFDTKRPEVVTDVRTTAIGDRFLQLTWGASSDDQRLRGYNIYLNGQKVANSAPDNTNIILEGLDAQTIYSVAVTASDQANNESFPGEILQVQTLEPDTVPPSPPTVLTVDEATGLAVKVQWEGASDVQTKVIGYNIYLNDELFNTDSLITINSAILKVLKPETEYLVQLEAVDAGKNVSGKSETFKITTTAFNPIENNLGIKTGKLKVEMQAMSFNEGIGINPDFKDGTVFNEAHTELLGDLKPGAIRWGALTANPLSFSDYTGAGKDVTIGKFIERCNQFGAYTAFCCGVENSTDWRQDPETFIRFLEYINGPDDSPGGQLRVAEGYSEPFLKNSPGLIFEFGNEVWGASAHNAQIGSDYNAYAKWCREIAEMMKESPYYDSTKIHLAISSRYPSKEHSYGLNEKIILGSNGKIEMTAPSGYLGGNLEYDPALPAANSELEYYSNVRTRADEYLQGMIISHKYEVEKTGHLMEQYMYESNTTTPTYNGRLGQALLSTDYYLSAMERGSAIPTIFHLTGGQWRITEPENNYRRLPLFITAKFINRFCKGDVLYNVYYSNTGTTSGTGAIFSERPVGAHTYRNDNGYSIVLVSRDYVDDHYVQVDLPDGLQANPQGMLYVIGGTDFNTKEAIIDSSEVLVQDGMAVKVPKHAMVLLHIRADEIETADLPLAWYPYPRIENITLTPNESTLTEPRQNQKFNVQIGPEDSWDKQVTWELLHNSGSYGILPSATYCFVYAGTNLENDTDSLILRASDREGRVHADAVIYLPNATGLEDIDEQTDIKFYPNPARDEIVIDLKDTQMIRIFNILGKKVFEQELSGGRSKINISNLSGGVYMINAGKQSQQLIINH